MENNSTTLPVFRECFCKRPDSQAGNLLCTAWEEKCNVTRPQSLFWHTLKIHNSGYLNHNNINDLMLMKTSQIFGYVREYLNTSLTTCSLPVIVVRVWRGKDMT